MPSKFYADLHIHSTASDGTFTPAEAVEYASSLGLKAIGLSDHDTVAGVSSAINAGEGLGVEVVPGIEMGSDENGRDIHILGYYVDFKNRTLLETLEHLKSERLVRAREMCSRLNANGLSIDIEDALELAPGGVLTRAHIARVLVNRGAVDSINAVFEKYLGNGKSCFVSKYNYSAADVISIIINAGGLPVLAHPKLSGVDNRIEGLVKAGLRGIEAYCFDHGRNDIKRYLKMADHFELIVTGGSDCHGPNTPGRFLMGECGVNEKRFHDLKAAAGKG